MTTPWHLAIDFGTSNSAAAHTNPLSGAVEALALSHRSNLIPSAVYVQEDGLVFTGDAALSKGRRDASRLVPSPKRYIGHEQVQLAGQDVPLGSIIGAVFRGILDQGRAQHANENPASVTITHPESWSVHNVDTLLAAADVAGIPRDSIRTITEPRAATVHYAAQQHIPAGSHVAVFDFGGGTLDIAVLRAEENGDFTVVAAKGDNTLGGRTIDNLLYHWVLAQVEKDNPDLADQLKNAQVSVMHLLDQSIREAKELLSDTASATITVSTPQGEHDFLITRDEFNQVIDNAVQRAVELTQAALGQAGVDKQTPIYMTGGSSRIPYVQDRLGAIGTVMTLDDPKTVVARGALTASMQGFTGDSVPIDAPKTPQAGDNPFGAGPGTAGRAAGAGAGAEAAAGVGAKKPKISAAAKRPTSGLAKNKFVLGAGAVLAVVVLFLGYRMFAGNSMVTEVNTTAADSMIPLAERYSTAPKFLPEKTLEVMQDCEGKPNEYSDDLTVAVYNCSTDYTDDPPKISNSKISTIYWIPGDDSKQAYEELESGKPHHSTKVESKERLQKSGRKTPEVGYTKGETGGGFVYAYYPKQKFTMYFGYSSKGTPDEIKAFAEYLGWIE